MFHHISLAVRDLERSALFYDEVLGMLGYIRVWADDRAVGYGFSGEGDKFAIKRLTASFSVPPEGFHVAFAAASRQMVDDFYVAALRSGGRDNGGSGLHPEYGEDYYAAFVFDPDGYRIEATFK